MERGDFSYDKVRDAANEPLKEVRRVANMRLVPKNMRVKDP